MENTVTSSNGLSSAIAPLIRGARIAAGMTQSALADKTGCVQSAVSMFEAGKRDALSLESVVKIAKLLKIDLPQELDDSPKTPPHKTGAAAFCPNFNCPSNRAYMVGSSLFLFPTGTAGGGKHCLLCGETLSAHCPACGAEIRCAGACCPACGAARVAFPHAEFADSAAEWTLRHNAVAGELAGLAGNPPETRKTTA